jgi:hypothetical protein
MTDEMSSKDVYVPRLMNDILQSDFLVCASIPNLSNEFLTMCKFTDSFSISIMIFTTRHHIVSATITTSAHQMRYISEKEIYCP